MWAEIWDDCPPLGDHAQYRSFVTQMFVEAKPYEAISYTDSEGKVHKLGGGSTGGSLKNAPASLRDQVAELKRKAEELRARKAERVASAPDG